MAVGAAIGKLLRHPLPALAGGMMSHLIGDALPHRDVGPGETPLVFATLAWVGKHHGWRSGQFWGALGAILPDFEHISYQLRKDPRRFGPIAEKWFPTHNYRIPHGRWNHSTASGVAIQVVLYVLGLWIAGALSRK